MMAGITTIDDVRAAQSVIHEHVSPAPLIRSYALENFLQLASGRRVWLKDYGWTPVGSFKLLGALNWMAKNANRIGDLPVAAHSSGNFASGISFAGMRFKKRVIVVMPDLATARADAAAAMAEREATLALLAEASADAADVQGRYDLVRRQLQEALEGPAGRVVSALMEIQSELVQFQSEADNRKSIKKSASGAGGSSAPPQPPAGGGKRGGK